MNFLKPKFWDKNKSSFFSVLLIPISLLIELLHVIKSIITKTQNFSIPIICVGNIYLGGTGKTPLCIEIFSILKSLKKNPAFIRKEYPIFQDEVNLQKKIGPVYQNKKRVDAIRFAIKNKINVAILDDGFQDFSINKNLSIICFTEKQWIGNGFTIPSGPLRENLHSLKRANLVMINGNKNNDIEQEILKQNKEIKIFYSEYNPVNIDIIKNKNITAFAGIGTPENFFDLLRKNNANIMEEIKFPDHCNYTNEQLDSLINKAQKNNSILVTTEKDYSRINENYKKKITFLKISLEIKNYVEFVQEIKKTI